MGPFAPQEPNDMQYLRTSLYTGTNCGSLHRRKAGDSSVVPDPTRLCGSSKIGTEEQIEMRKVIAEVFDPMQNSTR